MTMTGAKTPIIKASGALNITAMATERTTGTTSETVGNRAVSGALGSRGGDRGVTGRVHHTAEPRGGQWKQPVWKTAPVGVWITP